jgi:hypothetical protein
MKKLKSSEQKYLIGGAVFNCGEPPPPPPPNGAVWLPPNPDNPTANAPTAISPD